jgi:hypothetical protein
VIGNFAAITVTGNDDDILLVVLLGVVVVVIWRLKVTDKSVSPTLIPLTLIPSTMLTPTILESDGIFSNLFKSFAEFKFDGAALLPLLLLLPIVGCCDDCANATVGKAVNAIRRPNSTKETVIGINTFLFIIIW